MSAAKGRSAGICKVVAVAAALAAFSMGVGCEGNDNTVNKVGGEEGGDNVAHLNDNGIGTLCSYRAGGNPHRTIAFQNEVELSRFLDSTGYSDDHPRIIEKMTHQPNFQQWTYFAFTGFDYPRVWDGISEGKDTVTVNYTECSVAPPCDKQPCAVPAAPLPKIAVYFIPFTEKTLAFAKTSKLYGECN